MRSIVSIVECEDYAAERVADAVELALDLAELTDAVKHAPTVLLKPNLLSSRSPEEAVTTHPAVVAALARVSARPGCRVSIGDSPPFAGEKAANYQKLCERTGMSAIAREAGIPIVRFEEDVVSVPSANGRFYHSFDLARAAAESDLVVNIPKLKTHGLTTFSGAVKNVFGCVPGIRKGLFHVQAAQSREVFAQMLVDLLGAIRPKVNLMDAVIAMEGQGPNAGNPRHIGVILASSDPVALDAVACAVIGVNPLSIDTTRLAHEQGVGCGDIASIEVRGELVEQVRVAGFKMSSGRNDWERIPAILRRVLKRQLLASPALSPMDCIGCGDCARVCPVHVIEPGKPPTIDLDHCIRCYCCHEVCNYSAIKLKRGLLGQLLLRLSGAGN